MAVQFAERSLPKSKFCGLHPVLAKKFKTRVYRQLKRRKIKKKMTRMAHFYQICKIDQIYGGVC